MRLAKTMIIVHGHFFSRFDGFDADEGAIFFHFDVRRLWVIQINGHVHGVHAHDRNFNRFFIVVAKKFDLLLYAFGQFFDLVVWEFDLNVFEPTL